MSTSTVKCLVWDLDNTLWRGTLLEDGEVHLTDEIRDVIAALDSRGILQAVASKNDHDHAWARLEELGVAEFFVAARICWGAKSVSVREIADELGFAHSAIAFVDDRPAELAEVAHHLPDVRCYDVEVLPRLLGLPEFSPEHVTEDARRRRSMYQAGVRRKSAQTEHAGPDADFLRTLDMRMEIRRAEPEDLTRVAELTVRTSQMNATGVHYSDADLRALLTDPDHEVLVATMSDKFGPHGAIGVVLLSTSERRWHIKLLATSCRVVSYGAGAAILGWLSDQGHRADVHLVADFRATDRNRIMEIAYRFSGFDDEPCPCAAGLPDAPGVRRLHLRPGPRPAPDTLRLTAPELAARAVRP
ncbi:HAD-IIIC family phosphatase [Actinokineospora guangxiensis]|uniref:HAD-IIIC family phosphatase n=1 Tax=Actinokineospora guangxiensis TaxID=1490288 RepID=A0ABW0ET72_9PSEU